MLGDAVQSAWCNEECVRTINGIFNIQLVSPTGVEIYCHDVSYGRLFVDVK